VPPLAVQLLVSVEFQVSVNDWPVSTVVALADMVAVGAGLTTSTACAVTVPPPVHEMSNVYEPGVVSRTA
jgi:hypothetical protein